MKKIKYFVPALIAICVLILGCGCTVTLSAPSGFSVDADYNFTWSSVEHARGYEVEITPNGSTESSFEQTRRSNLSLAHLDEGDYGIRIRAISGEDSFLDSEWSESYPFHKDFENGCVYKLINNNTEYEVSKAGTASGIVVIESTYRGKPVTSIAEAAFRGNGKITSLVIEARVKTIGASAFFNCTKLVSITLPDSVTEIGKAAFQGCNSLKRIKLPDKLTAVGESLFSYCRNLEEVTFGTKVDTIGVTSFLGCTSLNSVEIPDSVKTIGGQAFQDCSALTSVFFGSGVQTIGEQAFQDCSALKDIRFSEANRLSSIGASAFSGCSVLETFPFREGLTSIGDYAFRRCSALLPVTLPNSITQIGYKAFGGTKFSMDALNAGERIIFADKWVVDYGISDLDELTELNAEMLAGAVGIADYAFVGLKLKKVTFPSSLRYIGSFSFASNESLWRVEIPDNSVKSIGMGAFSSCPILSNLILGEGLESIGSFAFYKCKTLDNNRLEGESMIPASVTSIGISAFKDTKLWENADTTTSIIYAGNWVVGYKNQATDLDPGVPSSIELREDTRGISDYAFYGCTSLKNITGVGIANVRYIGRGAFSECYGLSAINLNSNLVEIKDYTFYNCKDLFLVKMPANLRSIGRSAFYNCTRLSELDLSSCRVEKIGEFAFFGCQNIKEIKFGRRLTSIGDCAFYQCTALTQLVIPDTVRTIGSRAYEKCSKLNIVDFGSGVETIGAGSFKDCIALETIALPSSVKTVGDRAFYNCNSITSLDLGGAETIGAYAFYNVSKLSELMLPASVVRIGECAFRGCAELTSVLINSNVETIDAYAFYGCRKLTIYTDATQAAEDWSGRWNSSFRPVVWGCTLSEDGTYVVSVTVDEGTVTEQYALNGIASPERVGYTFAGWATASDSEVLFGADELGTIAPGTTLYAVWTVSDVE